VFYYSKELTNNTLHIRLAGIDAPESSAFGMPKQPGSEEAKRWLSSRILHQPVLVKLHRRDQYQRLVNSFKKIYRL
jgi:endonuclease YncB( thermonuclease family)